MPDLVKSVIFVLCQLTLLGLLLSPMLLAGTHGAAPRGGWRIVLGKLLAAILVITAALDIFKAEYQVDYARTTPLEAAVLAGKQIVVRFDPDTCVVLDLGNITCGADYHGQYDSHKNRWTLSGPDSKTGALITASSRSEPRPGSLSFWGMLSRFEEDGKIIYLGQAIGHLRLANDT
jgi:hypothetical protein